MSNAQPHNADSNAGVEWGTPSWLWGPLSDALGGFDLDPATGPNHANIAVVQYMGDVYDGLDTPWVLDGTTHVWLNPPYGRGINEKWAEKVREEVARDDGFDTLTCLVPASTSTEWWQSTYAEADILTFIGTRVRFIGNGDDGASFASCIASFGEFPDEYVEALDQMEPPNPRRDCPNKIIRT